MAKPILLSTPHMSDEGFELQYIHDAFGKNWIAPLGENVNTFEKAMGAYLGSGHPVALSAGTAALHLSMILAGVGPGDKVFCQDLTFAATVNPVKYLGAEPVFIDSEYQSWNMDPEALEKAFRLYGAPKAVIVVHLYGSPANMDRICSLCREYGTVLIEDAAEALGSEINGRKCGTLGRFGILSFNGNKIITTSGGGMLICGHEADARHALKLATQAREPFPWYEHTEIGYNYRLSNISAGIGCGQMQVLPQRVAQKRAIFRRYRENLADLPIRWQPEQPGCLSNRWLSVALLEHGGPDTVQQLLTALKDEDIEGRHVWKPMHMQPVFSGAACVTAGEASISADLFARGVCLPSDTKLTAQDIDRVCSVIRRVLG